MWDRFVTIGDSIAEGYGDPTPGIALRSWVDWVADGLKAINPAMTYLNLGWRGSSTNDVLRGQLPQALDVQPDLLCVIAGANDALLPSWTAASFRQIFIQLLQPFVERKTTILTFAYPDMRPTIAGMDTQLPTSWQAYFQRLAATNDVIRQVSNLFDACLLDFASLSAAQNPAYMSSDMVHPNALGYKLAGEAALKILVDRFDLPLAKTAD